MKCKIHNAKKRHLSNCSKNCEGIGSDLLRRSKKIEEKIFDYEETHTGCTLNQGIKYYKVFYEDIALTYVCELAIIKIQQFGKVNEELFEI